MPSEDMQNLIARLQMQQANAGAPSFAGIQAPTDPSVTNNILQQIQQQGAVDSADTPVGGPFGFLANAGKQNFQRAANQFSNAAQQGANILGAPNPQAAGSQNAALQRNAILAAKAMEQHALSQGADPLQAQMAGLQVLGRAGLDVSDQQTKLAEAMDKQATAKATQFKDTAQGNKANNDIGVSNANLTREQQLAANTLSKDSYKTLSGNPSNPNDLKPIVQINGNGEVKVTQKAPASAQQVAAISPDARQAMVEYYKAHGTPPAGVGRSPAMASQFWSDVANDPQASQAQQMVAKVAGQKADSAALVQTQKQVAATTTYINTFDANAKALQAQSDKLNFGDAKVLNRALQAWDKGTSDPDYAKYGVFLNTVANEYAKIQSGSLGNAPLSDSARHEAHEVISSSLGKGGMAAVLDAMRTDSKNKLDELNTTQQFYVDKLGGKNPQAPGTTGDTSSGAGKVVDFSSLK